jgi:hypothetical protein
MVRRAKEGCGGREDEAFRRARRPLARSGGSDLERIGPTEASGGSRSAGEADEASAGKGKMQA